MRITFIALTILCSLPLAAVEPDSLTADTVRLHNITVTGRNYRDLIPAQTLSGAELEVLRSHSVADALRYFSGLQIKDYGGIGGVKTVNIRSMGSQHLGVYYDGIELGNAQNGQVDLGKFSLQNVESIDLYNGQRSDILQSAREYGSAGSIYLYTRTPEFKGDKRINAVAGVRTGSFDLANPFASIEYKFGHRISLSANAEWIWSTGKYKFRYRRLTPDGSVAFDTTATRQNGDINALRAEAALHGLTCGGRWHINIYHYNSGRGIPGAIVNNVWRRGERLYDRNTFVQGSWRRAVNRFWTMRVATKYACDYTHYINNDDRQIHIDNTYLQQELFASIANRFDLTSRWQASVAADGQWSKMSRYIDVHRTTLWASAATSINIGSTFKAQASLLATHILEDHRTGAADKTRLTPALFASLHPWQQHNVVIRAFAKQSYRMPTFNDLYYTDAGNARLKPEMASQYNISISYDATPANPCLIYYKVGIDAYYNYVKDKIIAYPKGQQFRWTMLNLGKVDIRGIDANAMATLLLPAQVQLTAKAQYTYQRAIDLTSSADSYYHHQIPYIPHHSASATAMVTWRGFTLNYSHIYTGSRYNQQENISYNYMPSWQTSDLSLTKNIVFAAKYDVTICAEVNNLLNRYYDVILNYPMPGRNYKFTFTLKI